MRSPQADQGASPHDGDGEPDRQFFPGKSNNSSIRLPASSVDTAAYITEALQVFLVLMFISISSTSKATIKTPDQLPHFPLTQLHPETNHPQSNTMKSFVLAMIVSTMGGVMADRLLACGHHLVNSERVFTSPMPPSLLTASNTRLLPQSTSGAKPTLPGPRAAGRTRATARSGTRCSRCCPCRRARPRGWRSRPRASFVIWAAGETLTSSMVSATNKYLGGCGVWRGVGIC